MNTDNKIKRVKVPSEARYFVSYKINASVLYKGLKNSMGSLSEKYRRSSRLRARINKCRGRKYCVARGYGLESDALKMAIKVAAMREIRSVTISSVIMSVINDGEYNA